MAQKRPERLLARTSCVIKQLNRSYQQQGRCSPQASGNRESEKAGDVFGHMELDMSFHKQVS